MYDNRLSCATPLDTGEKINRGSICFISCSSDEYKNVTVNIFFTKVVEMGH